MAISSDIKNVYSEIGSEINVVGVASGEYIDTELNTMSSKPFIREAFIQASFPYDTSANAGNLIQLVETGDVYMMMNKTPDFFENAIIEYDCVLYKCNVSGELLRPSGEVYDPQTYHRQTVFELISSNNYSLQTEPFYGNDLITDDDPKEAPIGNVLISKAELYVPKSVGIEVNDRWQPVSGEYYRVDNVSRRVFPGVDVAILNEDTR